MRLARAKPHAFMLVSFCIVGVPGTMRGNDIFVGDITNPTLKTADIDRTETSDANPALHGMGR